MCLDVSGSVASLRPGWMLCTVTGLLSVVRGPLGPLFRWNLGVVGSLLTYMVFPLGYVDS